MFVASFKFAYAFGMAASKKSGIAGTHSRANVAPVSRAGASGGLKPFSIVGVGASAGGLEAFTELLTHLSADTGFGFVLVQHLDPQHESALTQLLSRATSMPVREVIDNLPVESNHVYVIPPNTSLGISNGILKLRPRPGGRTPARSIDSFFEALAEDQHERAIGVILSGTASDGTLGLESIKAEGGITFAQDESARYDSMPRSAVAAGCVDLVLNPGEIAKELARIARHPYVANHAGKLAATEEDRASALAHADDKRPLPSGGHGIPRTGAKSLRGKSKTPDGETGKNGFKKVLLLLHNHCGVDFSLYKSSTIQRRITRRMVLNKENTPADYAVFLRGNSKELDALYSDVLISVTSFFRNPEAFDFLKRNVFRKLIQQRGDDPFRVWILGCSTGQEAYSIAMAFTEAADDVPRARKLQVFATDLNEALLDKARHGLYARSLAEDISPERLRRFFVEEEGGYRVIKPLRDMVVFARQNLINDPPFSRMDLISCRNVLIYLEAGLQRKAIPTFHYALKPDGFLFLGASESVGAFTDLFEPIDKKHKIYGRKAAVTPALHLPFRKERGAMPSPGVRPPLPISRGARDLGDGPRGELNAQREADRVTVNLFAPPGVLIDANLQILQFRGPTGAFLQPPPSGKASFDVLKMAREGLMIPLRAALNKARKENKPARKENVRVQQGGKTRNINIEVIPLKNLPEKCFLILFEDSKASGRTSIPPAETKTSSPLSKERESRRVKDLETELAETREYLQSLQEQHEASSEELQASNEEVQSANEELQSINEELETSKEELESANEELTTVNEEMASRNAELNILNADLSNLQNSTKLPIVLLGRDLVIRRFSPPAEKIFNLFATDVGYPLSRIRHNLVGAAETKRNLRETAPFPIEEVAWKVIDSLREREMEVRDKEGQWYSLRVRPYMTVDNKIDGVVLTLVDISELKRSAEEVKAARDYAEMTLRTAPTALIVLHADLRVQSANDAFYRAFRTNPGQTEGVLIYELGNGQWNTLKLREFLEEIIPRNSFFTDFRVTHQFPGIGQRTMLLSARRLDSHEGVPQRIFLAIEDITPLVEAQADVRISEMRFRRLFETAQDGILLVDPISRKITDSNQAMNRLAGVAREKMVGKELWQIGLIANEHASFEIFRQLQEKGLMRFENSSFPGKAGKVQQIEVVASLYEESGNNVIQCNVRDITARKDAENEIRDHKAALEQANATLEQRIEERTVTLKDANVKLGDANVKLAELSKRLINARDDERARIARELHDEIGQALTGLKLFVGQMRGNLDGDGLKTVQGMISDIMQQARQLSLELHPQILDDLGLKAALDWHFKTFRDRTRIQVQFEYSEIPPGDLTKEIAITVFRLIQEALTNVAKYANVDRALVELFEKEGIIYLKIQDLGKGFDLNAVKKNVSFGLSGMRERVTILGGKFRVDSSPGKGTSVSIMLPTNSTKDIADAQLL